MRSVNDMIKIERTIQRIIKSEPKRPATKEQAWAVLRASGVANEKNEIVEAYREIFIATERQKDEDS